MGKHSMMGLNTFHVSDSYHHDWQENYRRIAKMRTLRRLKQRPEQYVIEQLRMMNIEGNYGLTFIENGRQQTRELGEFLPYHPAQGMPGRYLQVIYGQFATHILSEALWNDEADVADAAAEAVMHPITIAMATRRNAAVVVAGVRLFGMLLKPDVKLV